FRVQDVLVGGTMTWSHSVVVGPGILGEANSTPVLVTNKDQFGADNSAFHVERSSVQINLFHVERGCNLIRTGCIQIIAPSDKDESIGERNAAIDCQNDYFRTCHFLACRVQRSVLTTSDSDSAREHE